MLWYQELTLVYVLVSGPLHFYHKVFFFTTRWWTLLSLLNVGGKCNIIELVPFLLTNKFACLEPDLSQSGANSKISHLRNLLGSYFVADRLPYFPQMPTTIFKHEWYHFYPNFFYYLNMGIRKIAYTFLHTQNIKTRAQNNHVGKVNGSFFLKTLLQASNFNCFPMSEWVTIFTQMYVRIIIAALLVIDTPANSPSSQ